MTTPTDPKPMTPSWSLLKPSYELARKHLTNVMFLVIVPSLLLAVGNALLGANHFARQTLSGGRVHSGILFLVAGLLLTIINQGPTLVMALQAARGQELTLSECYQRGLKFFWRIVGVELLIVLVLIAGFALFVLPGLVVLYLIVRRYFMTFYYMVDKDLSIGDALTMSHNRTEPYFGPILGIVGVQIVLSIAASFVGNVHIVVSALLSVVVASVSVFLPVLRYREIEAPASAGSVKD